MGELIAEFEPMHTRIWPLLLTLLGIAVGLWLWRHRIAEMAPDKNRRMLVWMLLFFAWLIALFSLAGMVFNSRQFQPLQVYSEGIRLGKKDIHFRELRGYMIREDRTQSLVNPEESRGSVRSMLIEEKNGRVHLLPEEYYALPQLSRSLDSAYKAWQQR
jgi:hypothetical protein